MNDLIEFLRARLDERADALDKMIHYQDNYGDVACMDGGWEFWGDFGHLADSVCRPRQMRRDVEAKRAILDEHRCEQSETWGGEKIGKPHCRVCGEDWDEYEPGQVAYPCRTVRLMGSEWSTHPDYREEWKP